MPILTSKPTNKNAAKARAFLTKDAELFGLDCLAVTHAQENKTLKHNLSAFVANGYHGDMAWMAESLERRTAPKALWPDAQSVICFGLNYGPDEDPRMLLDQPSKGNISVYARHRDYHDVFKGKLKQIAGRFAAKFSCQVKIFVDTAPVMEKPLAQQSGLGWQGKHTNLVSRTFGSWLFLGTIFTDMALEEDTPETDHCGNCRACLDACPTKAFPEPYKIDARRCLSYLTIENKGPIPQEFRRALGNRIYGCDDCLAACPWNKFAQTAQQAKLQARADLKSPDLEALLALDDPQFRQFFTGSPIKRIGRDRFIRNCLIAAGNASNIDYRVIKAHLSDPHPIVRGAAIWALGIHLDFDAFHALKQKHINQEHDADVIAEWNSVS